MIKIKTFLALILIFSASIMQAQQIEIVKKPLDIPQFYQNGKKYKMGELVDLMKPNFAAVDYMKKARSNYTFAQILGITGGALVGHTIGTSIGGGDPNWALAIAGGGVIALSIPFITATTKNSIKAVDLYNAGLSKSEDTAFLYTLKFGVTGNGVGVVLQF